MESFIFDPLWSSTQENALTFNTTWYSDHGSPSFELFSQTPTHLCSPSQSTTSGDNENDDSEVDIPRPQQTVSFSQSDESLLRNVDAALNNFSGDNNSALSMTSSVLIENDDSEVDFPCSQQTVSFSQSDESLLRNVDAALNNFKPGDDNQSGDMSKSAALPLVLANALQALSTKIDHHITNVHTQALEASNAKLVAELHAANEQIQELKKELTKKEDLEKRLSQATNKSNDLTRELALAKSKLLASEQMVAERGESLAIERSLRMKLERSAYGNPSMPGKQKNSCLVVGSSLVRDFDQQLYENTEIICISGARPNDLTKALKDKAGQDYDKIIVVAGGNQVGEDPKHVQETVRDLESLVKAAKEISGNVHLCELPPRIKDGKPLESIQLLNVAIQDLSQKVDCKMIKTSQVFTLGNGEPNDGYLLPDGIHLKLKGASKLVDCLGLALKDPQRRVSRKAAYADAVKNTQPSQRNPTQLNAAKKKNNPPSPPPQTQTKSSHKDKPHHGRPARLHPENGYCGYCGEPGHRHETCHHGQPVECRTCHDKTHKAKFCHLYIKSPQTWP